MIRRLLQVILIIPFLVLYLILIFTSPISYIITGKFNGFTYMLEKLAHQFYWPAKANVIFNGTNDSF